LTFTKINCKPPILHYLCLSQCKRTYNIGVMINNLLIEKLSYNGDYTTPTTVQLVSYSADSCNKIDLDPLKKEEFHYSPDITYWINVDGLNQEETIEAVAESVNLNFLLIQDILNVHHPTKIEEYEDFL